MIRNNHYKLQLQPNSWSCLPTAFAIMMRVDVHDLIDELGHDGSEIIWPEAPSPYDRRGFHPQELIELATLYNYWVVTIEARPVMGSPYSPKTLEIPFAESRLENWLKHPGVIGGITTTGKRHAVAWTGKKIINPSGNETTILNDIAIETFFRF